MKIIVYTCKQSLYVKFLILNTGTVYILTKYGKKLVFHGVLSVLTRVIVRSGRQTNQIYKRLLTLMKKLKIVYLDYLYIFSIFFKSVNSV